MSRILGRVENPRVLEAPLYFVHDSTSGHSFPPLFSSTEVMWNIWDKDENFRDLEKAVPAASKLLFVGKISFAYGREFDQNGETFGEPTFGLATPNRLISTSRFEDRHLSLLKVDHVTHIAEEVLGGFDGNYDRPLCMERCRPSSADRSICLDEVYDQSLHICSACVAKVTNI
ncbi:hypothetical protein [Pseudoduganella sp. R-34]|uniref:hypothetical protein n=1 Tax=Pseudoduganella sp. R-34 TaxID=3404062 RepID=UPI003CFA6F0B